MKFHGEFPTRVFTALKIEDFQTMKASRFNKPFRLFMHLGICYDFDL